jgi:predicted ATP-dependent endonuclease of OLD family
MKPTLLRFRVINFRSIKDSGWIDTETLTCLVGTNESGKTNLLVGLWKLNPANDEPIDPLIDYPRKKYVDYRGTEGKEIFIQADFKLDDSIAEDLAEKLGFHKSLLKEIRISRRYNGTYLYEFPSSQLEKLPASEIIELLSKVIITLNESDLIGKEDEETIKSINKFLNDLLNETRKKSELNKSDIYALEDKLDNYLLDNYKRKININSFFTDNVKPTIRKLQGVFEKNGITCTTECEKIIKKAIPSFVFYSDYGNLDSEIYLPHVIQNMARTDLGEKERAKARSLKVLFEFVSLQPKEILELGQETPQNVNAQTIESEREKKKKREILLQSASNKLTDEFRGWWKQGNYRFRFQADGNHFRIWVSDDLRTEEVELEGRSRGLQWFFSFFLVFLVESKDSHSNCILLLDEPGLSLHPLAQYDLITFFESLSNENQLLYTTHSPFLVNPNNLGNVKALYIGDDGSSIVSSNLRGNEKVAAKSIYPIHAAIGLTISDTLLLGCIPLLVEGPSDQIYLQLIKNLLISRSKYNIGKEVVFIPTGGVKGMSPVIKILLGRENELPPVIIDTDTAGKLKIKQLKEGLYKQEPDKIIPVSDALGEGEYEIEDLFPGNDLARVFSKKYRGNSGDDFEYVYDSSKPIVNQMEDFAKSNGYDLDLGWKVELAKDFQKIFDKISAHISEDIISKWAILFQKIA